MFIRTLNVYEANSYGHVLALLIISHWLHVSYATRSGCTNNRIQITHIYLSPTLSMHMLFWCPLLITTYKPAIYHSKCKVIKLKRRTKQLELPFSHSWLFCRTDIPKKPVGNGLWAHMFINPKKYKPQKSSMALHVLSVVHCRTWYILFQSSCWITSMTWGEENKTSSMITILD